MQKQTLVIIVTSYPFGYGEPFLEAELKVLAERFRKMFIVIPDQATIDKSVHRFNLPSNVEVILIDNPVPFISKIFSIASIFTPRILEHLWITRTKFKLRITPGVLKILFAYEARGRVFRKILLKELESRNIGLSNVILYTYWFTAYTLSLVQIKARHPEVKAVTRAHGWDIYFERHTPPYLPLRKYIIERLDRVITISDNGKNYLLEKIPDISSSKIVTHRLGTNIGELQYYHPNGSKISILSLSFLTPVKHVELLIDALSEVNNVQVEWHHIGDGDEYAQAIRVYSKARLENKSNISYAFHGTMSHNEIAAFLREKPIDVIVNTSHSEGLPVSLMEAMAFSIPAIAPDIGGISEIIEDGKNGFLLSPQPSPKEFAGSIEKYFHLSPAEKNEMKEYAHKTWQEKFCTETNHRRFADELYSLRARPFQVCARCILDSSDDASIMFDELGICSLCRIYDVAVKKQVYHGEDAKREMEALIQKVKKAGDAKSYDCIIGLSGGVDSTYVAWKVKELGLRPLAVHLDNGWDSELAVKNIENIVRKLDIDLYTHVINWDEFRDLQRSYFKAGVIDLEIPTDHAIMAILYDVARKNKIKYILSGHNLVTEGFLPDGWIHHKFDVLNLNAIHKKFGTQPLKTYPLLPYPKWVFCENILGIKVISLLNYLDYDKNCAKQLMKEKLSWRDYGGKHYESIFTRFYQAYILPKKFGVDKRKSHYSTLICSGQLDRSQALELMKSEPYSPKEMMESDRLYVIKKLGFTEKEWNDYMKAPIRQHNDYPSYMNIYKSLRPAVRLVKKLTPGLWS